ncbi:hypothetical protein JTE90_013917 [Oedothorax gibbosus]|uniref:GAG-pre-integrase domain-containing protein n=1 Tax=Oedothorax gibbosus TaxID=931172 RepID=A0AAV6UEX3_9ARAC|nr:hypothetical protein JTE90_013917 [Oedothorax gibbosus]
MSMKSKSSSRSRGSWRKGLFSVFIKLLLFVTLLCFALTPPSRGDESGIRQVEFNTLINAPSHVETDAARNVKPLLSHYPSVSARRTEPGPNARDTTAFLLSPSRQFNLQIHPSRDQGIPRPDPNSMHASGVYGEIEGGGRDIAVKWSYNFLDEEWCTKTLKLENVPCVAELKANLLSNSKWTRNNRVVVFDAYEAKVILEDGSTMLRAERKGDLYFVEPIEENAAVVTELENWHQKFGHLNVNDLKKLESQNMVRGLTFRNNNDSIKVCEICIQTDPATDTHGETNPETETTPTDHQPMIDEQQPSLRDDVTTGGDDESEPEGETTDAPLRRVAGRPRKGKTSQRGRPRKLYHYAKLVTANGTVFTSPSESGAVLTSPSYSDA